MGLEFYKGNKAIAGSAAFLSFDSKTQSIFINLVKQTGWNEETHHPIFRGGLSTNVKFSMQEIAAFLDALDNLKRVELYHVSDKKKSQIYFGPYTKSKDKDGNAVGDPIGIALAVVSTNIAGDGVKEVFKTAFSFPEARLLKEWFVYALKHCFDALYSADVQRGKEFQAKKKGNLAPAKDTQLEEPSTDNADGDSGGNGADDDIPF